LTSDQEVAYNLRLPGQVFDGQAGLHQNGFRDYDPATGRYIESDPIGLQGGTDTYGYANDRPSMLIDQRGLFTLTEGVTYQYVAQVPGGGVNVGGGTNPTVQVKCECSGCGGTWKLKACHGEFHIDVALRAGVSDPGERDFYRKSEGDHVRDLQFGAGRLLAAGQRAESSVRGDSFGSQQECEGRTASYVAGEMQPVLQAMFNESHARWDYFLGPHQWWSLRRWFGQ